MIFRSMRPVRGSRSSLDARLLGGAKWDGGLQVWSGSFARGDAFVPIVAEDRGAADRRSPPAGRGSGAAGAVDRPRSEAQVMFDLCRPARARDCVHRTIASGGAMLRCGSSAGGQRGGRPAWLCPEAHLRQPVCGGGAGRTVPAQRWTSMFVDRMGGSSRGRADAGRRSALLGAEWRRGRATPTRISASSPAPTRCGGGRATIRPAICRAVFLRGWSLSGESASRSLTWRKGGDRGGRGGAAVTDMSFFQAQRVGRIGGSRSGGRWASR